MEFKEGRYIYLVSILFLGCAASLSWLKRKFRQLNLARRRYIEPHPSIVKGIVEVGLWRLIIKTDFYS